MADEKTPFLFSVLGAEELDMRYLDRFKSAMIQRMTGFDPMTAGTLSKEVGVAQATLSRWLRKGSVDGLSSGQDPTIDFFTEVEKPGMKRKRPKDWSPEAKLQAVLEASGLPEDEFGAFLRRKGIHATFICSNGERRCSADLKPRLLPKEIKGKARRRNVSRNWKENFIAKKRLWQKQPLCWY